VPDLRPQDGSASVALKGNPMPRRAAAALLITLALGAGLSACGGSDTVGDVVPASTPALVPPTNTQLAPAAGSAAGANAAATGTGTDTTSTDTTSTDATTPDTSAGTATPDAGTATPDTSATPDTGGGATATPDAGTADPGTAAGGDTGGGADAGGFSTFCKDNPGACPDQ
jgi:hypothetical protein